MNPLSQWHLTRNRPDLYAIAGEYAVRRDAFRYADIPGSADTVGWQTRKSLLRSEMCGGFPTKTDKEV